MKGLTIFLLLFAITIGKNCAAQRSTSNDTLCLPATIVEKLVIAAQQKKGLQEEVDILNQRIAEKEAEIAAVDKRDKANEAIIASLEKQISIMKDQRGIYETQQNILEKQIRKQRRKVFWTAITGAVTTTAAIFLFK